MTCNECEGFPVWLTKEYLQDKLRKFYKDESIVVNDLNTRSALGKGENYCSRMARIHVSYVCGEQKKPQTATFIAKYQGDDQATKTFSQYGMYERELRMYAEVLPRLAELMREMDDTNKLFPETVCVDFENSALVFEDLTENGYVMADRIKRLDMAHALVALRKLATFHALATVLNERQPAIFAEGYDCGMYNRHTRAMKPFVTGVLSALERFVASHPALKEKYVEKLQSLQSRVMEYAERVFEPKAEHFMTLAHSDFWTNNIMFKYERGLREPADVCILDFQLCVWASPAVDLHYFLNTSLLEELRLCHQPELIQFYYNALTKTLRALRFKGHIPSLFNFNLELQQRRFLALTSAFIYQPVMTCRTADADAINLISDSEAGLRFRDSLFQNEQIQKGIERLLPIFDQMGLLDDMD